MKINFLFNVTWHSFVSVIGLIKIKLPNFNLTLAIYGHFRLISGKKPWITSSSDIGKTLNIVGL